MFPHPWLRLNIAIRAMMSTRWSDQWPAVKLELGKAAKFREVVLRKAPWWN